MVKVLFVHPDLGIGGAERLVIDAALALKKKGHDPSFITAHHDPTHCFPETVDGSVDVLCVGDWLPRCTFGCMYALWAYVRMVYLAFYLVFFSGLDYDALFVDQVSACIPVLRLRKRVKIIFYCHYPDQLLTDRKGVLKRLYRYYIDKIEEYTTKSADVILVNSQFTASVFKGTFTTIQQTPVVLYPSFDFSKFDTESLSVSKETDDVVMFLSLNRYERKKNVRMAIDAFHKLLMDVGESDKTKAKLVIAGGYDSRVPENIQYYSELKELANALNVSHYVQFLQSPSDDAKLQLLREATCLLYTPSNEHFGIVPIEAMYVGTPVIAVNSGGPTETVVDGVTGFLREPDPEAFASAMKAFLLGTATKHRMSKACREHVVQCFSFDKFANDLHQIVTEVVVHDKKKSS